jgi:hypothetical protein
MIIQKELLAIGNPGDWEIGFLIKIGNPNNKKINLFSKTNEKLQ